MKKLVNYLVIFSLIITMILSSQSSVKAAGSVSVTASKTSVNVGDTVTITISVSSGYGVQGSLSRNSAIFGGTSDSPYTIGDAAGQANSTSFSYTATQEGSCTFSANVLESYDGELNPAGISGGAVTVTVNNAAGNSSSNSGDSQNGANNNQSTPNDNASGKSDDSSLKSLIISEGVLSPEFSSGTKNYTAIVDYSISSIAVSATPNSDKAKVSSVSGNANLQVGENTVKVVVKAENGVSTTYTIVVIRRDENDPENSNGEPKESPSFSVNGEKLVVANEIPQDQIPQDFTAASVIIGSDEYPGVSFNNGNLQMVYLTNEEENGGAFYVYDQKQGAVYPFVKLSNENHYVIILEPIVEEVPDNYIKATLSIEGKGTFSAFQTPEMLETNTVLPENADDPEAPTSDEGEGVGFLNMFAPESVYASEANSADIFMIYCMNDKGECGWYNYDSVEETYMRVFKMGQSIADYQGLLTPPEKVKKNSNFLLYIIMAIMSLVIIVLLIAVAIFSKNTNKKIKVGSNKKIFGNGELEEAELEEAELEEDNLEENELEEDELEVDFSEAIEAELYKGVLELETDVDKITEAENELEVGVETDKIAEDETEVEKTEAEENEVETGNVDIEEVEVEADKIAEDETEVGKTETEENEVETDNAEAEENEVETDNAEAEENEVETDNAEAEENEVETGNVGIEEVEVEADKIAENETEVEKTETEENEVETDNAEAEENEVETDNVEAQEIKVETDNAEAEENGVETDNAEAEEIKVEIDRNGVDTEMSAKEVEASVELKTESAKEEEPAVDNVLADLEARLLEKLEKEPIVAQVDDEGDELQIIDL